jgi:hypothetical protein
MPDCALLNIPDTLPWFPLCCLFDPSLLSSLLIQRFAQKHEGRLHHHENGEALLLLENAGIVRRLQRKNPFELFK